MFNAVNKLHRDNEQTVCVDHEFSSVLIQQLSVLFSVLRLYSHRLSTSHHIKRPIVHYNVNVMVEQTNCQCQMPSGTDVS